ncbi:MAG: TetR/AcrR family transcriptional regulator [Spirochaetia bacterium]|jgi:AcrR family transcriptional regulator
MEEKKEKAIEKAREYFHTYGYRGASLASLISDIGISKPTFYNYFKNKEELFSSVMRETYSEFPYQYNQRARSAPHAMEKLDLFITTFAWFLDTYPIFRDLFKPGNDLLARWAQSRSSKDFFAEGVQIVRSILEQGIAEGIFSGDIDAAECALLLYYLVLATLSTDPNLFQRPGHPELKIDARALVRILGRGILARSSE